MTLIISQFVTDENFPTSRVRPNLKTIKLQEMGLSTERWIYCGDILGTMARMKLLPGSMSDLLHYSQIWDGRMEVIALGSLWKAGFGDYYAGCLRIGLDGPELSLRDADFGWTETDYFLVSATR